jgi:hypothetical protein
LIRFINNNLIDLDKTLIANLELLSFNEFCNFYRLSVYDSLTAYSVCKIFKKVVDSKIPIDLNSQIIQNESKINSSQNKELKKLIENYLNYMKESETFSLIDTVENLINFY